jgi:hypothetical protein
MTLEEDLETIQPGDALPLLDFSALDEALQDFDTFVNSPNPL